MPFKDTLLALMRRRALQPMWEQLQRVSVIGQNFWASTVSESGELRVLTWLAGRVGKGAVVLDVGGNLGQYAIAAAVRLRPERIYSFEPSQVTRDGLHQAIRAAGLDGTILPQAFALSDRTGTATLHSSHACAPTASLHDLRNPIDGFRPEFSEQVELQTVDGFCSAHGIEQVALLKIDVEGHELSVLRGAGQMLAQGRIAHIQFEFGEANLDSRTYFRDFHDLLAKDYDLYRIVSDGLRGIPCYRPSLEVFATMNYFAVRKKVA